MQKIRVVALQNQKARIVKELHRLGMIEIRKSSLEMDDDVPGDALSRVSELMVRYNSAEAVLRRYLENGRGTRAHAKEAQPSPTALIKRADSLKAVGDALSLEEKRAQAENEVARARSARETAALFLGSGIDFSKLSSETLEFAAYLMDWKARKALGSQISALNKSCEVVENRVRDGVVIFVACRRQDKSPLGALEHARGVRRLDLSGSYLDSEAEKIVPRLDKEENGLVEETRAIEKKLREHARDSYAELLAVKEMLAVEAERESASINFKRTEATFVIEGWIESRRMRELTSRLQALTSGRFEVENLQTDEFAPTLISRKGLLEPFDKILEFFSLPRSDELDPTIIFALSFPIFYGLMVSDVGYGLVSLAFAALIARVSDPDGILYSIARVWEISAVAVIFFGFLSNQYFGYQLNRYFTSFSGFDWLKNTTSILAATIIFGIAQVTLGLALGFINSISHGHRRTALSKLTSILVVLSGTIATAGSLFGLFGAQTTQIALGVAVASLLATIALSGMEAAEIMSLVSHPLSYARIMGFGLASVILALLINKALTPSLSAGVPAFVLGLLIFIILHFVNMLLGTFEGLVQGIRLNFVEFFSKFYTGGGVKFKPFYYKRRYTKEV